MQFTPTAIPDVILIEPKVLGDARGFFMETYQARLFEQAGINCQFVQDNHSGSRRGALRGLHYQIRQAQGKLLRVVVGEVFDVAVDLRRSSPSFGRWVGCNLSAENRHMLWIPPGFAHGFYVLSEWVEVVYKTSDFYAPEWERALLWSDPDVGIEWPLTDSNPPVLSSKDAAASLLRDADLFD